MLGKKHVVYITRKSVWGGNFSSKEPKLVRVDWDGKDLSKALFGVSESLKSQKFDVVVGNDLSYVFNILMDPVDTSAEKVLNEIARHVPDSIDNKNAKWTTVGTMPDSGLKVVQVSVVDRKFLIELARVSSKKNLHLDLVVPVAELIAVGVGKKKHPSIVLCSEREVLGLVIQNGSVYMSRNVADDVVEKTSQMMEYAGEKFGLKFGSFITNMKQLPPGDFSFLGKIKRSHKSVVPMKIIADMSPEKLRKEGKEPFSPIFEPVSVKRDNADGQNVDEKVEPEKVPLRSSKKVLVFEIIFVLVAISLVVFYLFIFSRRDASVSPAELGQTEKVIEGDLEPAEDVLDDSGLANDEVEESVDLASLVVVVLNGSGEAGAAGAGEEALESVGFSDIETGNTGEFDYEGVVVNAKESLPDSVFEALKEAFSEGFGEIVNGEDLPEDSDVDLEIIIGR